MDIWRALSKLMVGCRQCLKPLLPARVRIFLRKFDPSTPIKWLNRDIPLDETDPEYERYWAKRAASSSPEEIWPAAAFRANIVAREIEPSGSLLDIGCGDGSFLVVLKKRHPDTKVMGVDISETAVRMAKARGVPAKVADLLGEPEHPVEIYDYVCQMCLLEHVQEAEALFQKGATRCRKRLFVAVPNLGWIEHRLRLALFGRCPITTVVFHIKEHIRFWTYKDFIYWADALGWRVVKSYGLLGYGPLGALTWAGFHSWWPSLTAANILYVLERKAQENKETINHS